MCTSARRLLPALAALVAGAVLGGCGSAAPAPPPPILTAAAERFAASGPASMTPPATDQQTAVVAMLFPTSGPEARWTQGLTRFVQAVRYQALRDCVAARHAPMPLVPPPAFVRFYDLPDLAYIRRHGFADPIPGASPAAAVAPTAQAERVQQDCLRVAAQRAGDLQASYQPLQAAWFRALAEPASDPAVERAYRGLPACLHRAGIRAADEPGFFAALATAERAARQPAAVESRYAAAYGTCMAPVEAARIPARRALRNHFLAAHDQQIRTLQATLVTAYQELSRTTGIQIQFPVL